MVAVVALITRPLDAVVTFSNFEVGAINPLFSSDRVCETSSLQAEATYTPVGQPSFWITVSPDGNTIAYMTPSGNFLMDVSPGSIGSVLKAPGMVDLQFSADGIYYTIVNKHSDRTRRWGVDQGTSWYLSVDLLAFLDRSKRLSEQVYDGDIHPGRTRAVDRLAIDRDFYNHYHSMGTFTDEKGRKWHRILNDFRGASMRDYMWDEEDLRAREIIHLTSDSSAVDSNGQSYFDLPMLSKNGRYFSAYNRKTMTTQIFKIENHRRRMVFDLGIETGKVGFSYSSPHSPYLHIAFHVDLVTYEEGNKMSGKMFRRSKDILIYRLAKRYYSDGTEWLEKDAYAKITSSPSLGEGYYYPKWSRNDRIYFVKVKNSGPQKTHRFVKFDLAKANFLPFQLPLPAINKDGFNASQFNRYVALGGMWARLCTNYSRKLSATTAALQMFNMSEKSCYGLAAKWPKLKESVLSNKKLFELHPPHNRKGRIRPDGRWTRKGEDRQESSADAEILDTLTVEDLQETCHSALL